MTKIAINNTVREMTAEEQAEYDKRQQAYIDDGANRKLTEIKKIRLEKLIETDFLAMSDNVINNDMKNFRKKMRDIPQDFTTESQYDTLLARDTDGKLTHSIWSKP